MSLLSSLNMFYCVSLFWLFMWIAVCQGQKTPAISYITKNISTDIGKTCFLLKTCLKHFMCVLCLLIQVVMLFWIAQLKMEKNILFCGWDLEEGENLFQFQLDLHYWFMTKGSGWLTKYVFNHQSLIHHSLKQDHILSNPRNK